MTFLANCLKLIMVVLLSFLGVGFRNGFLTDDPRLPVGLDEIAVADVTQPLYGPSEANLDLWTRHTRMIMDDKVEWRLQLNVRNVLNNEVFLFL